MESHESLWIRFPGFVDRRVFVATTVASISVEPDCVGDEELVPIEAPSDEDPEACIVGWHIEAEPIPGKHDFFKMYAMDDLTKIYVGELQPMPLNNPGVARYAVRCRILGHTNCSRCCSMDLATFDKDVFIQQVGWWLLHGYRNTRVTGAADNKFAHMKKVPKPGKPWPPL